MSHHFLPPNVMPLRYDIKLIPHNGEDDFTFEGESSIKIHIFEKTNSLYLHVLELKIDRAATKLISNTGYNYVPTSYTDKETQVLILRFHTILPRGQYTLHLKFVGCMANSSSGVYKRWYHTEKGTNKYFVAVKCGPTSARRIFPCWDEPAFKATFNISIKHERNYTALSNMPIEQKVDLNDNIWTHFKTTPNISTFHVAFVIVTNDFVRIPTRTDLKEDGIVTVWCRFFQASNLKYTQEVAVKSSKLLTKYTNNSFKIPKIDLVLMPSEMNDDLKQWGLILCGCAYEEGKDNIIIKHKTTETIVIQMTHQWLTNIIDPSWWSHALLNQGLVLFVGQYIIIDQMFTDLRKTNLFVIDTHQKALHADIGNDATPVTLDVNTPEEIAEFLKSNYAKAPSILRMLYHILTGVVFRMGIFKYLKTHQLGTASSDDLWSAFQCALNESHVPHADYNVKEVMDTWIRQKHYPVVYVTRNYKNGDVILTQKPVRPRNETDHADDKKWWIPITFTTQSKLNFSNTRPTHWLRPQDESLIIKGIKLDDWVIVNLQSTGYYRVEYDFPNWYKIADYLNSSDFENIHVLNRAQFLDDYYHLMAHPSDLARFKELANYLHRETDYIAWAPTFNFIRNKEDFYNSFENIYSVKTHLVGLLTFFIKHVGFDEVAIEDEFTKFTRVLTLAAASEFGNTECAKIAKKSLESLLTLSPNTQFWVLSGARNQRPMTHTIDNCVDDLDRTVLQKTWSQKPNIFINLLIATVSDATLPDSEYNRIFDTIVQKHADNDLMLEYLLANIDKTTSRGYTREQVLVKIIKNVHSAERLKKIKTFVKDLKKNHNNEIEQITTTINRRKTELKGKLSKS